MGRVWPDDPGAAHEPRKRRRQVRDYGAGSRMQELMNILTSGMTHAEAVDALAALYPRVPRDTLIGLARKGQRAFSRGGLTETERLAHRFIVGPGRPGETTPAVRVSWWRRLWRSEYAMGWVFCAAMFALLLTGVELTA